MDLLSFERKLDSTIMRKRLEIQEALRRPMKQKRKLRVFISHQFTTPESGKVKSQQRMSQQLLLGITTVLALSLHFTVTISLS